MDNEPSTDLPPPKRPWNFWQWLLLITPSLLAFTPAGVVWLIPSESRQSVYWMIPVVFVLLPFLCFGVVLILGTRLAAYKGSKGFLAWLGWCAWVLGLNLGFCAIPYGIWIARVLWSLGTQRSH